MPQLIKMLNKKTIGLKVAIQALSGLQLNQSYYCQDKRLKPKCKFSFGVWGLILNQGNHSIITAASSLQLKRSKMWLFQWMMGQKFFCTCINCEKSDINFSYMGSKFGFWALKIKPNHLEFLIIKKRLFES